MSEKVTATTTAATYAASGITVIFGLSAEWWGVIAGFSIGILTYITNWCVTWHFKRRDDKRAEEEREEHRRIATLDEDERRARVALLNLELEGVKLRKEPREKDDG
jgi:uncharacterized membrane protein YhiD involved in acid resistance